MKNATSLTATLKTLCLLAGALFVSLPMQAASISFYGNNAGSGPDLVDKFSLDTTAGTATLAQAYNVSAGNGRGVVVVGNILYTTQTSDSHIYKTDLTTGASLGSIATALPSMSTIAWDGANFWTTDYSGTNQGYELDINGNIIKTVTFSQSTSFMDGMEWFNGKLIVNNADGCCTGTSQYSIYDLNGTLLTANFIAAPSGTGIAFDGTNFLVNNVNGNSLNVYDGTTGAFIKTIVYDTTTLIEDVSVDYATRPDTGGPGGIEVTGNGTFAPNRVRGAVAAGEAYIGVLVQINGDKHHRHFTYSDPSSGISINSENASNVVITGRHAHFNGSGKKGKRGRISYEVDVYDNSPNGTADQVGISLSNGYSAIGDLDSGDLSIHN
jgi:hypothetical protein